MKRSKPLMVVVLVLSLGIMFTLTPLVTASPNPTLIEADTYELPDFGTAVSFSPDGNYIAVGHRGSPRFTLLDHSTPGQVTLADTHSLANTGAGVSFSPDGNYIAIVNVSPGARLTLLDHTTPGQVTEADTYTLPGTGWGVSFSPDGNYIAVTHMESPEFILFDHTTPGQVTVADTYTLPNSGRSVSFSPDGNYIAVTHYGSPDFILLDHTTPGQVTLADTYTLPADYSRGVSFSPDGNYIAVTHLTPTELTLLDHTTPGQLTLADTYTLPGLGHDVSFSPDGNYIAVGHEISPYFTLLDHSAPGQLGLANTYMVSGPAEAVSFSPDGNYIAIGHWNSPHFTLLTFAMHPTVTTEPATGVTINTGILHGDLDIGDETSVDVFLRYRETGAVAWQETASQAMTDSGPFDAEVTGLTANTEHEFKGVVQWDGQEDVGDIMTFTTLAIEPTVTTEPATDTTIDSATVNMEFTVGDYSPVEVRFSWRGFGTDPWTETTWASKAADGTHVETLTGLDADTTYEFYAQLRYNNIVLDGTTLTFTTEDEIEEPAAECIATDTSTGTACFTPSYGIVEDLTAVPAYSLPSVTFPHAMFSFKITGLTPGQTVTLTVELPSPVPVGTVWWKYDNGRWHSLPNLDDNGNSTMKIRLTDGGTGDMDNIPGQITDPGGPGNPMTVGWEGSPVSKSTILWPWMGLLAVIAGASLLMLKRRRTES